MKVVTAEELEAVISEIGAEQKEFHKWAAEAIKKKQPVFELVKYRLDNLNHIQDADLLYLIFLGIKIGRAQMLAEDLEALI